VRQRLVRQRLVRQRLVRQRLERQRLERQRLERQRLERQRLERQRLERQQLERQRLERQQLERQQLERQQLGRQQLERQRRAVDKGPSESLHHRIRLNYQHIPCYNHLEKFDWYQDRADFRSSTLRSILFAKLVRLKSYHSGIDLRVPK